MATPPPLADLPPSLTSAELWDRLGADEHERLDFKVKSDGLGETVAAMAMTDGGLIVIGIADSRHLKGCALTQAVRDSILGAAHGCAVSVEVREVAIDGTPLVIVEVPEVAKRIVTTPNGRLLRRVGSRSVPLTGDALARFVVDRSGQVAEDDPIRDPALLQDLDLATVNSALAAAGRPPAEPATVLTALADLGLAELDAGGGHQPTRAAAILFARDPRRWTPGAAVQVVRRLGVGPGTKTTQLRQEIASPLPKVVEDVIDLIAASTHRFETVVGTHREALPEYPRVALREAITNAVGHRDYGLAGATVDVTIWDDRVEICSPGPLPGHMTVENLRIQHYSRNRRLMRILKLMGLVEEYGEGIDRMIDAMEQRLMDAPTFTSSPSSFTVTIRNASLLSPDEQVWFALLGHLDLAVEERRLLAIVKREGSVTPRKLREVMPVSSVDSLLKRATTKGLVARTGRRGGTRYTLSVEVAMRAGQLDGSAVQPGGPQLSASLELRARQRQLLLDEVRARGSLTTAQAAALVPSESPGVARDLLDDLVRAGLVAAEGRTRGRRYEPATR